MTTRKIILTESTGVATLTLNRPEFENGVDPEMMKGLEDALNKVNTRGRSRIFLLRGEGDHFCARLDLGRVKQDSVRAWNERYGQVARVNRLLRSFPGVSIALVKGKTLGFGFGLAAQADLTIAAQNARFAFGVIKSGQPPTLPISYLGRLIPRKKAFELLITGTEIDAYEAERLGVVNRVVATEDLESEGKQWASRLLALDAEALMACKEFFRTTAHLTIDDTARYGVSFLTNFVSARGR